MYHGETVLLSIRIVYPERTHRPERSVLLRRRDPVRLPHECIVRGVSSGHGEQRGRPGAPGLLYADLGLRGAAMWTSSRFVRLDAVVWGMRRRSDMHEQRLLPADAGTGLRWPAVRRRL